MSFDHRRNLAKEVHDKVVEGANQVVIEMEDTRDLVVEKANQVKEKVSTLTDKVKQGIIEPVFPDISINKLTKPGGGLIYTKEFDGLRLQTVTTFPTCHNFSVTQKIDGIIEKNKGNPEDVFLLPSRLDTTISGRYIINPKYTIGASLSHHKNTLNLLSMNLSMKNFQLYPLSFLDKLTLKTSLDVIDNKHLCEFDLKTLPNFLTKGLSLSLHGSSSSSILPFLSSSATTVSSSSNNNNHNNHNHNHNHNATKSHFPISMNLQYSFNTIKLHSSIKPQNQNKVKINSNGLGVVFSTTPDHHGERSHLVVGGEVELDIDKMNSRILGISNTNYLCGWLHPKYHLVFSAKSRNGHDQLVFTGYHQLSDLLTLAGQIQWKIPSFFPHQTHSSHSSPSSPPSPSSSSNNLSIQGLPILILAASYRLPHYLLRGKVETNGVAHFSIQGDRMNFNGIKAVPQLTMRFDSRKPHNSSYGLRVALS